jgi:hypothetical protein
MPEENDLESEIISFGESTLSGKEKVFKFKNAVCKSLSFEFVN